MNKIIEIISDELTKIPLYKNRGTEECFLGIRKSQYPKWYGFRLLKQLKRNKEFPERAVDSGLYEYAINFWFLKYIKDEYNIQKIKKGYEF